MRRISGTGTEVIGSPTPRGRRRRNRAVGFTLVEILVVVAITGIIVALASVNLFPSDREVARREVARVALAIEHARDAAWFGGRPTAISFSDGRARLWRHGGNAWQPDTARDTTLHPALAIIAVTSDGHAVAPGERLVFLPDGLDDPFRVALEVRGLAWAVDGDAAGSIRVVER